VLIDSIDELALTAFNAANDSLADRLEAMPNTAYRHFKANRFHFQRAGDALPLMHWSLQQSDTQKLTILSEKNFRQLIGQAAKPLSERTQKLFDTRRRLRHLDRQRWLKMHQPCQPLWSAVAASDGPTVILTHKDRAAVLELARALGLALNPRHLFTGDGGLSKARQWHAITASYQRSQYWFVDDSIKNLKEIDSIRDSSSGTTHLILADWGYLGPADRQEARQIGLDICSQADVISQLHRMSA
jgi:hypothetical protein